jgi:tripartite-type tricarboxylate transporter receptor subunit TctC
VPVQAPAQAQPPAYPVKPITFVVPSPAGGGLDVLARTLADEMSKRMGQPIIVDNKPGASGILGVQTVARAAPDGYTVLITHSGPVLTVPYMYAKAPYDVRRELSFVSQLCTGQLVLAVNATNVPATNMKEFMAWAEKNKGKVNYGSFGIGTSGHLLAAYLSQSRQLDMTHVAYKGESGMIQDLVGGQIAWGIASVGSLAPHIASGRVRALAVLGDRRPADLPNVPTMAEQGFKDPEFKPVGWVAMLAPANLPAPVLERLEKEARAATQTTAMKARFQAFGMEAMGTTSAEFRRDYDATAPVAERLIKLSGAKID